jgi:hypothetical protein
MVDYPIRVFVGCAPNGMDAESQMVLESSMRRRCDKPIEIVWMAHSSDPDSFWHGWNSKYWKTPFSGFRWGIPEYCGYKGQAIYMDSDMIIMDDIDKLWREPFDQGAVIMVASDSFERRTCVAKFDCRKIKGILPPVDEIKADKLGHSKCIGKIFDDGVVQFIDKRWNNYEGMVVDINDKCIVHYTNIQTQPHLKYAIPRLEMTGIKHWFAGNAIDGAEDISRLFDSEYEIAIYNGYAVDQYSDLSNATYFDIVALDDRFDGAASINK